jgi:hypothetical protein
MKTLPPWLSRRDDGVFEIDPDLAYPAILKALGIRDSEIDQYWLEVAYQCAKLHVQELVSGSELDPRPKMALQIHILSHGARKDRWALRKHKAGRGARRASEGREAKVHYPRIRNLLGA